MSLIFVALYGAPPAHALPTILALRGASRGHKEAIRAHIEGPNGPHFVSHLFVEDVGAWGHNHVVLRLAQLYRLAAPLAPSPLALAAINWPLIYVKWPMGAALEALKLIEGRPMSAHYAIPSGFDKDGIIRKICDRDYHDVSLTLENYVYYCDFTDQRVVDWLFDALHYLAEAAMFNEISRLIYEFGNHVYWIFVIELYYESRKLHDDFSQYMREKCFTKVGRDATVIVISGHVVDDCPSNAFYERLFRFLFRIRAKELLSTLHIFHGHNENMTKYLLSLGLIEGPKWKP